MSRKSRRKFKKEMIDKYYRKNRAKLLKKLEQLKNPPKIIKGKDMNKEKIIELKIRKGQKCWLCKKEIKK